MNELAAYSVVEATFRARGGRAWAVFDDAAKRAAVPRSTAAAKKYDLPTGSNWEDWVDPVIDEMAAKGIVLVAGSGANTLSVLEYSRTRLPSAPKISSVTGPVAADFR